MRVFEEAACAALEVNYYDGESACKNLNGQLLGSRPVVVTHLIEFPDEELMSALSAARLSVRSSPPFRTCCSVHARNQARHRLSACLVV